MITTREVVAASWANELNRPNPMILKTDATNRCSQAAPRGIDGLRPCRKMTANKDAALIEKPRARSVKTPTSSSAIFVIGQLSPQTKASRTSRSLALVASSMPRGEGTNAPSCEDFVGDESRGAIDDSAWQVGRRRCQPDNSNAPIVLKKSIAAGPRQEQRGCRG